MLGIIGGSGIYSIGKFEEQYVNTPYGFASVHIGKIMDRECAFIPRHGSSHAFPPHKINYRANAWAMKQIGVTGVLATYACGAISEYSPGDLIAIEDFLGFSAPITFYEDFKEGIRHTNFTRPYSDEMNARLFSAGRNAGVEIKSGGIVATMPGPRYETPAEIRALRGMGANLVSMTNAYETVLFHELEILMAGLAIATNYAAGISNRPLSHSEVIEMMEEKEEEVKQVIRNFASLI